MQAVAKAHLGQRIVVFTHGGVLDCVHRFAAGNPSPKPRLNCCISSVRCTFPASGGGGGGGGGAQERMRGVKRDDGYWEVLVWASAKHLRTASLNPVEKTTGTSAEIAAAEKARAEWHEAVGGAGAVPHDASAGAGAALVIPASSDEDSDGGGGGAGAGAGGGGAGAGAGAVDGDGGGDGDGSGGVGSSSDGAAGAGGAATGTVT